MKQRISIIIPAAIFVVVITTLLVLLLIFINVVTPLIITLIILSIAIVMIASILFYLKVLIPLARLVNKSSELVKGSIPDMDFNYSSGEVGLLEKNISDHLVYMNEVIRFTQDISRGERVEGLNKRGVDDQIGDAMIQLKERLMLSEAEEEKRRTRDEQQNWSAQGLARIGELLRNTEDNIVKMSNEFIKELVKYMDMEVGGFYIVNETTQGDPVLTLTGSYAFDRKKQLSKSFSFGEGLIGRCAMEKETIVITDVPEEYIKIRTGLGEDAPSTLIIVPVLLDDQVLGVIELATFSTVPQFKIDFINSLSNSIAASLTKVSVNRDRSSSIK